jgi:hypothetical protein
MCNGKFNVHEEKESIARNFLRSLTNKELSKDLGEVTFVTGIAYAFKKISKNNTSLDYAFSPLEKCTDLSIRRSLAQE